MLKNPKNANEKIVEFLDPQTIVEKFDKFTKIVIGIFGVAFITLLIMVATLVIDSFHINSATYREYSEKIESIETLKKNTESIFKENIKNQELILKQQELILKLLAEKKPI